MRIRHVWLQNFMIHDETDLTLPERGVVLITGANGNGKSTLCEGVAQALWGQSLRGADPWREGVGGRAHVEADLVSASRTVAKGGKKLLSWELPGADPIAYETTTKAQDALEAVIGPFDVWRRACVFSGSDASHFSQATDAERKRLLEAILGLDVFDVALARARKDLIFAEREAGYAGLAAAQLEADGLAAWRRIADGEATLQTLPSGGAAPSAEEVARLQATFKEVAGEHAAVRAKLAAVARRVGAAQAEHDAATKFIATLERMKGTCPTCRQAVPPERLLEVRETAAKASASANTVRAEVAAEITALEAEDLALHDEAWHWQEEHRGAETTRKQFEHWTRTRDGIRRSIDQSKEEERTLAAKLAAKTAELEALKIRVADLGAVDQVLGLRGVRAHVLGRALGGLEAAANAWLGRIAGAGLSLKLSPYTEKAGGGTREAIGISIEGAGGGRGYKAASGGQRRRIDVALMLALSEVAQAAYGRKGSTLLLDEVLDHPLDDEGRAAAAPAIRELARDRCVVVITHARELVRDLEPVMSLRAEAGKLISC